MSLTLIQSESDFLALKEDWNLLLTSSASHVPFLRHEYLSNWWQTLGGGEWEMGSLAIVTDRSEDGSLEAIAPLFLHDGRLLFLGSFEISDYLDLIAPAERLPTFIPALFSYLQNEDFPEWQILDLYNIQDGSPSLPFIRDASQQAGFQIKEEMIQPAPYLDLPTSWQDYLASLKDRYRREIERKLANAGKYFLPVTWYIVSEEDTLESELDAFLELMANHPQKEVFLTPMMVQQIKIMAREGFQEDWLQLAFLKVGDIRAAGYMNFDFDDQIWIYNTGIDPLFENLSPGWVLLSHLIKWAIENGKRGLDFMRGDEIYKYQFGGIEKKVLHLVIEK
jgi:CelD/BcsL family acetyltransferase involved in cellulose biosynthesis